MTKLNAEFRNIQNPGIGAFILWNFTRGYYLDSSKLVPVPLLFIVLPIVFREDLSQIIQGTNKASGLRFFANKFISTKVLKNDVISQIHVSADYMKVLSLNSLRIAMSSSLISIDSNSGLVYPLNISEHKSEPNSVIIIGKAAEKLGFWCSQLTLHEISQILKVRF